MRLKDQVYFAGGCLLVLAFLFIGFLTSHLPLTQFFLKATGTFNSALWDLRRLDVLVQILLIFTAALGILVFSKEGKGGK